MGAQLNFVAKHGMMKRFLMLRKKLGWPCIAAFVSERDIYGYLDADNVVLNHQQVWESSVSAFKSTTASRFTFLQNEPNHQRIWGLCSQLLSLGQTSSHAVFPRDLLRAPPGPCRLARPLRRLGIHGIRRSEATESLHGATDEPRGSAGPNGGWDEDGWGFLFGTSLFFFGVGKGIITILLWQEWLMRFFTAKPSTSFTAIPCGSIPFGHVYFVSVTYRVHEPETTTGIISVPKTCARRRGRRFGTSTPPCGVPQDRVARGGSAGSMKPEAIG